MDDRRGGGVLAAGFRLEEFEIERELGAGGFGVTYLAHDRSLDRQVAIKEYLPRDWAERRADGAVGPWSATHAENYRWGLERFLEEARVLARLHHPHVVQVYRVIEARGTAYMVTEYVEGRSLAAALRADGPWREPRVLALLDALTAGLGPVHAAGLAHRDIKPANVMLRGDGSPVLIDFGAARQAMGLQSRSLTAVLTPGYAPFEQYSAKGRQGPWTDVYALGAVAYEALSGRVPEEASERMANDTLPPVAQAAAHGVSPGCAAAIGAALALRQEDRPQSLADWRSRLGLPAAGAAAGSRAPAQPAPDSGPVASRSTPVPSPGVGSRGVWLVGAAALVLVALAAVADLAWRTDPLDGLLDVPVAAAAAEEGEAERRRAAEWGAVEVRWIRRAADQGYTYAQYNLGGMYLYGAGVPRDAREAVRWYRLAADQGDAEAQHTLGFMYAEGRGVPQDDREAARWYRLAADRGFNPAQFALGIMYAAGRGVPADDREAVRWYRIAADNWHVGALTNLGFMYATGRGVPQDDGEAVRWYRIAADQGYAAARFNLGVMYYFGRGAPQDTREAVRWWGLAADQGHADAQAALERLEAR